MQVRHCANLPLAVSSRVESVTTTSLAKVFIKTSTTILMPPTSSPTEYVPYNPIVTTEEENKKENLPAVEECVSSVQDFMAVNKQIQEHHLFTNSLVMHAIAKHKCSLTNV